MSYSDIRTEAKNETEYILSMHEQWRTAGTLEFHLDNINYYWKKRLKTPARYRVFITTYNKLIEIEELKLELIKEIKEE